MVDFADSPEQATFRAEVRRFIDDSMPGILKMSDDGSDEGARAEALDDDVPSDRSEAIDDWRKALADKGWIAPAWPKEYGGAELSETEQYILNETFADARAPRLGVPDVGSTIMVHGNDDQKSEFLPPMVQGDTRWCQGYSEPGSGSDLASVQTRGTRDGDDFVINGQKIWTSNAHLADMMFALVRTDPDAPKHRGISYILLSMKTPGISVRRMAQMHGGGGFNEVFFEDVRVPVKNVVGEVNRGWYVGATHLDFERSSIGMSVGRQQTLDTLRDFLVDEKQGKALSVLDRNSSVRSDLADRYTEAAVATTLSQRVISMQARGQIPNYEASITKLFGTECNARIGQTATRALGMYGGLGGDVSIRDQGDHAPQGGRWSTQYMASTSSTIAGGTSEIQRNVIATRGLGLPRG
jgi:alkylation response protein AidB-like acyl-CoA dehydrogenase